MMLASELRSEVLDVKALVQEGAWRADVYNNLNRVLKLIDRVEHLELEHAAMKERNNEQSNS